MEKRIKKNNRQMEAANDRIITLRGQQVIIDRDVAELYGVETKRVNEALKNNREKFPKGYVITLQPTEKQQVVENFDRFKTLKHSPVEPHAFTEQGLYMLATILKSPLATQTTIAIIDTFTKLRQLSRNIATANDSGNITPEEQKSLQNMMTEVLSKNPLPLQIQKMTFCVNLGIVKISVETAR